MEHRNSANQILESLAYTYDAIGNRTSFHRPTVTLPLPNAVTNVSHNDANQMLTFNAQTPNITYDNNGNMTSVTNTCGTTTYTWNVRNQLVGISGFTLTSTLTCSSVTASFKYDAVGRRIEKMINTTTTKYLYDGLDIVQEIKNNSVYANYIRTLNIDEPLARIKADGTVRYYQTDVLGSVIALTDQTGAVKTTYAYDPFGNTTVSGEASDNPFQYTGRENDGTGLYYYRARYYSPELQRFISEDPIGLAGGINQFAYVGNNPVNFVDPWGLFEITVNDTGGRNGSTYGGTITVTGNNGQTITVPGSSWPNPTNPSPGVAPGIYPGTYSPTGHKGTQPGVRVNNGGNVPTNGPNPAQGGQSTANGINIHCGYSQTNRGSAGCVTIEPSQCQDVWSVLQPNETGTVRITR